MGQIQAFFWLLWPSGRALCVLFTEEAPGSTLCSSLISHSLHCRDLSCVSGINTPTFNLEGMLHLFQILLYFWHLEFPFFLYGLSIYLMFLNNLISFSILSFSNGGQQNKRRSVTSVHHVSKARHLSFFPFAFSYFLRCTQKYFFPKIKANCILLET